MKKQTIILLICVLFCSLFSFARKAKAPAFNPANRPKNLSDSALLELVQKQTFRYFWDFAHPVSGMARERSNTAFEYGNEVVTTGGTGFGVMSIVVAANRGWITRDTAAKHLLKMVKFLWKADAFHGVFPHWLNGETGKVIRFSRKDDGGDLVEHSFLLQGLLCARQYFNADNNTERELRNRINWIWRETEWDWYTRGGEEVFYRYMNKDRAAKEVLSQDKRVAAREFAQHSMVLLKNEGQVLPLKKSGTIALVGALANNKAIC